MKCKRCKATHESAYNFATSDLCTHCYQNLPAEQKAALADNHDLFRARLGFDTAATPALRASSEDKGGLWGGVLLFLAGPTFLGLTTGPLDPSPIALLVAIICWVGAAASIAQKRVSALACITVVLCAGGLALLAALVEVASAPRRTDTGLIWLFLAFRGGVGVPLVALSLWSVLGISKAHLSRKPTGQIRTEIHSRRGSRAPASIHEAVVSGDNRLIQDVIERGCDLNAPDTSGQSPIHLAARDGEIAVVSLLLRGGADINATNSDGWTPLHCAARRQHVGMVQQLLTRGANAGVLDAFGRTALDIAKSEGFTEVAREIDTFAGAHGD